MTSSTNAIATSATNSEPDCDPAPKKITIRPLDPLLFLFGNRGAIERLAGSFWTLLIGAILVLSAGVARNYDHLYFLAEWEWLYGPFLASIISSLIIFLVGCFKLFFKTEAKHPYLCFLSLYWMTAPCAWLYGIPVESFTDLLTATKWNVAFLAIVSIWRVLLMIRSLHVLTGEPLLKTIGRITFPASAIMMIASFFQGLNIVGIMGGVRLSPNEKFMLDAVNFTTLTSFWIAIVTFFIFLFYSSPDRQDLCQPLPWKSVPPPKTTITACSAIALIGLLLTLPFQSKARNNHEFRSILRQQKYSEALDFLATKQPDDFLPTHDFPPGTKGNSRVTNLILNLKRTHPTWLRQTLYNKIDFEYPLPPIRTQILESENKSGITGEELWQEILSLRGIADEELSPPKH